MKWFVSVFLAVFITMAFGSEISSDFIPEASGVCRQGKNLIIAGDEEPQSLWVASNKKEITKLKVLGPAWDDMEGLASVDQDYFFGVTSHSRTKKGKRKPEREQLLLMGINGNQIKVNHSWNLREQALSVLQKNLAHDLDLGTVESAAPNEGGLNIEGLAYFEGKIYLGLRSPVTKSGKAIILVVRNADELFQGTGPDLDSVLTLDLEGKGIRGLDVTSDKLFVLAGTSTDADENFGVAQYSWSSRSLRWSEIPGIDKLLRPEGIIADANGDLTFVQDFETPQNQDVIIQLLAP